MIEENKFETGPKVGEVTSNVAEAGSSPEKQADVAPDLGGTAVEQVATVGVRDPDQVNGKGGVAYPAGNGYAEIDGGI